MVFLTGDCHGDFRRFSSQVFPEQNDMTKEDTVIILGDFGLWHDTDQERYWLNWLDQKSFEVCFLDGNHSNFDRLYSDEFPIVEYHGGKAHRVRDHIHHLMRGNVFSFDGKTFWAFGGAKSYDVIDGILDQADFETREEFVKTVNQWRYSGKVFRINHISWWKQELPSQEEMDFGLKMLEAHNNKVDYIITHCCPHEICLMMGYRGSDVETEYFNEISRTAEFDQWYFGHHHMNRTFMKKYHCLYEKIERIV